MSLATGERDVGEEYFRRNSFTPFLTCSKQNKTSFEVLPGLKKIIVSSSSYFFEALYQFQVLRTDFSN